MNPIAIIATLRKFGNYIAGIFPGLVKLVDFISERLKRLLSQPALTPLWDKLYQIGWIKALWVIFERFYWRTYSKDRLDLSAGPEECIVVLRPIFQLCVLVCLLIPISQLNLAPQVVETFAGYKGTAPAWCIYLWTACLPCAWAAALTGAALCNRLIYLFVALCCLYFMSTCVILTGRSPFNAILGLTVWLSLFYSELKDPTQVKLSAARLSNVFIVSIACFIEITILTPLRPLLGPFVPLPAEMIGITIGTTFGTIASVIFLACVTRIKHSISMGKMVFSLYLGLALFLVCHLFRTSAGAAAGMLVSSLSMTTSYFWPIWYFIGIGIVHKLMGSTKVVVQAVDSAVPSRYLAPVMTVALGASLLFSYSDRLAFFFATHISPGPVGNALCTVSAQLYHISMPFLFSTPVASIGTHWLSLVLLLDLLIFITLATGKKLKADTVIRIFYMTCLAALLIWEYLFQYASFGRTPSHNILIVFFFALWLLWLMHTVGWSTSLKSSPLWPVRGRLALYSGVVMFCLLEIAAKATIKDFRIMNEIFLNMFRGVIDVGLPYYMYIWASKRVKPLPTSVKSIFYAFCLGALFAFILNPCEKLAACHWSIAAFKDVFDQQIYNLNNLGNISLNLSLPPLWLLIKSSAFVAAMLALLKFAARRHDNLAAATQAFLLMSFAGGLASFSRTFVDLPLPTPVRVFFAPLTQDLTFNCSVFNTYLAYWIPALLISIALLQRQKERATAKLPPLVWAAPLAVLTCFVIFVIYREYQEYLRASGLLYPYMTLVATAFVALVMVTMRSMENTGATAEKPVLLDGKQSFSLLAMVAISAIAVAAFAPRLIIQTVRVDALGHPVNIAQKWRLSGTNQNNSTLFTTETASGPAYLGMGKVPSDPHGSGALLKTLLIKAATSGNFPEMQILKSGSYEQYKKDTLSCHFSFMQSTPAGRSLMMGLTVLYPRGAETEYYTLCAAPTEMDNMEWEMAMLIKGLK